MRTTWNLAERTAFITGAARGIGEATARRLRDLGMNVVLAGLEPERLGAIAHQLGEQALAVSCDVTSNEDLEAAVSAALERFGAIDVVVANAGVNAVGTLETSDLQQWERVIEVNLLGVTRTVRAALPHVIARRGYVLPVASVAAVMPLALGANYTAAKHGVHGFAQALRLEVAGHGVDVGCAYFGAIDTDMVRTSAKDPAIAEMMSSLSGLIAQPIPATAAAEAIARGVAGRRRRVYAPSHILPLLVLPAAVAPLIERAGRKGTRAAVALANQRARSGAPAVSTFVSEGR